MQSSLQFRNSLSNEEIVSWKENSHENPRQRI